MACGVYWGRKGLGQKYQIWTLWGIQRHDEVEKEGQISHLTSRLDEGQGKERQREVAENINNYQTEQYYGLLWGLGETEYKIYSSTGVGTYGTAWK